jgi:hypothetical protein
MIVATSPHLSNAILIYNYSTQQVTLQACVGVRSGVRVQLRACGYAHVRQIVGDFPLVQIVTSLAISPDGFLLCVGTAGEATQCNARARMHARTASGGVMRLWPASAEGAVVRTTALCVLRQTRLCCADRLVKLVDAEEGTFQDFVGHQGDSTAFHLHCVCARCTACARVCAHAGVHG